MLVGGVDRRSHVVLRVPHAGHPHLDDEVAAELAKVTWPSKKEVTNSTMVVIVDERFATVYLALLDRFWASSPTSFTGADRQRSDKCM